MKQEFFIGKKGLSATTLKTFAIIGMTLDHIGIIFYDYLSLPWQCALYALGGLTFPIMAYFIGEGYRKTRDYKKYMMRLFIFALIAQIPFSFMLPMQGNVIFTLLFGLICIHLYETMENRVLYYFIFAFFTIISVFFDWMLIGVPMVLLYYTLADSGKLKRLLIPYIFPIIALVVPSLIMYFNGSSSMLPTAFFVLVGSTLTIPLLYYYNGEKGKSIPYFFYIYYPLHILIIVGVKYLMYQVI